MEPITTQPRAWTQPQVSPELQKQRATRRKLVVVVIALVVIAGAAGAWWTYKNRETSLEFEPGKILVTAQTGNIVSEFPKELILEKDIVISNSYRIDYTAGNVGQPVAVYDSKLTMAENLTAFRAYFTDNGWEITNEGDPAQSVTSIYAEKESAEANVTLESLPDGKIQVIIAYNIKK